MYAPTRCTGRGDDDGGRRERVSKRKRVWWCSGLVKLGCGGGGER